MGFLLFFLFGLILDWGSLWLFPHPHARRVRVFFVFLWIFFNWSIFYSSIYPNHLYPLHLHLQSSLPSYIFTPVPELPVPVPVHHE